MNLDQYLQAERGSGLVSSPVAVKVGGRIELHSLNRILYGPPPKEPAGKLRRRMADLITRCVTNSGSITRDDLLANFTGDEVDEHFTAARRLAALHRLGETL